MATLYTVARRAAFPTLLLLAVTGCQTTPWIDQAQPEAIATAVRRAQFEMGCPSATGEVLSRDNIVSPLANTFRFSPPERAEYTIGISGCGKKETQLVICTDGGGGCVSGGRQGNN